MKTIYKLIENQYIYLLISIICILLFLDKIIHEDYIIDFQVLSLLLLVWIITIKPIKK
jgi:hypothetical protein